MAYPLAAALAWSAVAALVSGCGARSELFVEGSGGGGSATTATTSAGGQDPACADAPLIMAPGPCSAQGLECDVGGMTCGTCDAGKTCLDGRCYIDIGPGIAVHAPDVANYLNESLLRSLYADPEGELCKIQAAGALELVQVNLWNAGITGIVMEVSTNCGGELHQVRTVHIAGSMLPAYNGDDQATVETLTLKLDPPVALQTGEELEVTFHAIGAGSVGHASAVEEVSMKNIDPACRFEPESPGGAADTHAWDFRVGLFVHDL